MAKRRVNNVTANNASAPVKEPVKKAPKKVPEPPMEEEDLLSDEEMNEMEAESKPSMWTRIKESKPVKIGIKLGKGMILGLAVYGSAKLAKAVCSGRSRSSDDDDYEDEYDDDSSSEE